MPIYHASMCFKTSSFKSIALLTFFHYNICIILIVKKMVSGAMHKSQDLFMHTVKYSFSTKQLQPTTDLHRLPLPWGVSVFLYLHTSQKTGATEQEGSQVAFARTEAEYSHDLFWKQKTFSRFRMSRIIRFKCWRRGLGG